MYDLIAVVRHNGDTPDSGHYIAWVKQEGELWIQYDDAMATMHISHEVLNLCGGGEQLAIFYLQFKNRDFDM